MRICLFTPTFFPKMGGQEMVVDQLARHFTSLGHEIVVLAQHGSRRGTNVEVKVPYRLERFRKPISQVWGIPGTRRALAKLYRSWPFEIVHSHSCYPTGFAAINFCHEKKIPLIVTSHGGDLADDSRFRARPVIMKRSKQTLEQADAVTFISSYMQKAILEVAPDCATHLHSIPNGVDFAALTRKICGTPTVANRHSLKPDSFVLFLGRLHNRKGVDVLIKAFQRVAGSNPNASLVIAGDGTEISLLRSQSERTGIANRIHFAGSVRGADRLWLLQNCLCLVLPTRTRETFGLVLLEAMANRKPVIGTRLGGILDLIEENQNGFLVQPNDVNDLARALVKILSDPELRAQMGNRAAEKALLYDWPKVARQYLTLFEELLKKSRHEMVSA